jgi:hypothetical protein
MGVAVEAVKKAVKEAQNAISAHRHFGTHVIIIDASKPLVLRGALHNNASQGKTNAAS